MARFLSEIGKKLSRIFWGRIVVKTGELRRSRLPDVMAHTRKIEICSMRPESRVKAAFFCEWKRTPVSAAGSLLCRKKPCLLKVFDVKPGELLGKCAVQKDPLDFRTRANARSAVHKMKRVPATRKNRLPYLKKYPKFEKASLLALYSPLYREKIVKSALDKASGNLLFWYDIDRVKVGERNHLLLLRVFGGEEPLKWVWLPVDKK